MNIHGRKNSKTQEAAQSNGGNLIDLREVTKAYQTAAGDFTALKVVGNASCSGWCAIMLESVMLPGNGKVLTVKVFLRRWEATKPGRTQQIAAKKAAKSIFWWISEAHR